MHRLRTVFWAAVIALTVSYVLPKLGEWQVASRIENLRFSWIVLAGAILLVYYAVIFTLWTLLLRTLGSHLPGSAALRAYSLSLLPKYVPGLVVSQGVRARLAAETGAPLLTISTSLVLEMALAIGSAGVVALLGLARGIPGYLAEPARWLALVLAAGSALLIAFLVSPSPMLRWKQRLGLSLSTRTAVRLGGLLALYTAGWSVSALSHWALACAIRPVPFSDVVPIGTALAISWGVGALSLFAPAGLGVKDGILYLSVRGLLGNQNALVFATLSRLLSIAVEILITASYWIFAWARRGTTGPVEPRSVPPPPS